MEARLCPPPHPSTASDGGVPEPVGSGADLARDTLAGERDVTWGEFLLFFLPSLGPSDDAYNAGLLLAPGATNGDAWQSSPGYAPRGAAGTGAASPSLGGRPGRRCSRRSGRLSDFGGVTEDAASLLQMVVPAQWTPAGAGGGGVGEGDGALGALSVARLRREVRRLGRERAYLLGLLREDASVGARRAEAVHDQYRHELGMLCARVG